MNAHPDASRRLGRTILLGLVIAAIVSGFLLQMAHGVCPVP
jgi:hypothetical protein